MRFAYNLCWNERNLVSQTNGEGVLCLRATYVGMKDGKIMVPCHGAMCLHTTYARMKDVRIKGVGMKYDGVKKTELKK